MHKGHSRLGTYCKMNILGAIGILAYSCIIFIIGFLEIKL